MVPDTPPQAVVLERPAVPIRVALILATIAAAVLALASHYDGLAAWMKAPDAWTYDWRTAHFAPQPAKPRPDIVVVLVDETSLEQYPSLSPVSRRLTATLLAGLEAAGAKAVGLDFLYDRATQPGDDEALLRQVQRTKIPVVLAALDARSVPQDRNPEAALAYQERFIAESGKRGGHAYFSNAVNSGRLLIGVIGDSVIRHRLGRSSAPPNRESFAAELAESVGVKLPQSASLRPVLIDWQRQPASGLEDTPSPVLRVASHRPGAGIADMLGQGFAERVRGRIVLIGGGFGDRDRHLTPFSVRDGRQMSGVLVHAQILAQVLDTRSVRVLPLGVEFALLLGAALIGWWLARIPYTVPVIREHARLDVGGLAATLAAGLAVFVVGVLVYALTGVVTPSATLFFALLAGILLGHPPRWFKWVLSRLGAA